MGEDNHVVQYNANWSGNWSSWGKHADSRRAVVEYDPVGPCEGQEGNSKIPSNGASKPLCRNGRTCNAPGCDLYHVPIPKPCRNGQTCAYKTTTCLFQHRSDASKSLSNMEKNGSRENINEKCFGRMNQEQNMWLRRTKN